MTIDLMTKDGALVTTAQIPPFEPPPQVVTFGARSFELMPHAGLSEFGTWRYQEVTSFRVRASMLEQATPYASRVRSSKD
jgi:hypothetical protein